MFPFPKCPADIASYMALLKLEKPTYYYFDLTNEIHINDQTEIFFMNHHIWVELSAFLPSQHSLFLFKIKFQHILWAPSCPVQGYKDVLGDALCP